MHRKRERVGEERSFRTREVLSEGIYRPWPRSIIKQL